MSTRKEFQSVPVEITKAVTFEAAHRLGDARDPEAYRRVHGHSFRLEATLRGQPDPERGWVDDLGALTEALRVIASKLDHGLLNEIEGLERPTLERICAWAAAELQPVFPSLHRVSASRPSLGEACVLTLEK
jgi:6-pyruvoyltetrahydropterin/6-carboxytetrahydropterin synthase